MDEISYKKALDQLTFSLLPSKGFYFESSSHHKGTSFYVVVHFHHIFGFTSYLCPPSRFSPY